MSHLSHKLPWNALSNSFSIIEYNDKSHVVVNKDGWKTVIHFSRCFLKEMEDFAKTDNTPQDEVENKFNLLKWDRGDICGGGGHLGVITSLITGYISLNLLFNDRKKFSQVITANDWHIQNCCGTNDGKHPEWMSDQIIKLINNYSENSWMNEYDINRVSPVFKEFNSETIPILSEYLKAMFKTLYLHVKTQRTDIWGNGKINLYKILSCIIWMFSLPNSLRYQVEDEK